ncbi:MAG: cupin domain-containing protein [Planctomycetota bacterium]
MKESFFTNQEEFRELDPFPGIHIRACSGERMTVSILTFDAGSSIPAHAHPHEQMGMVLAGSFVLSVEGRERELREGDVYVVPPGATHSARAAAKAKVIDIFSPRRKEYA